MTTPRSTPQFTPDELAAATRGRWLGAPPSAVAGVSTDTRTLSPGQLFVALKGERFDAHDHLEAAAAAGAAALVVSEAWAAAHPAPPRPALAVADPLAALGAIARHHRCRFGIPVIGVTGSNGKTTTREMIAAILATRGPVLKTEGNLNNEVGVPLTLFGLEDAHATAVIEMGMNHPGEIARLAAIAQPQVGVVTLAAPAHLEGLGTVDAVADAKAELYEGLPAGGIAVVNADDARMLKRGVASGRRMLTFASGRGRRGDVVVLEVVSQSVEGLRFVLGVGNREVPVHIPGLVGAHNARNAAAAACAAIAVGCTDREIAQGLAAVRPVGRRLRLERLPSGVQLVDDCYNANPASMSAALDVLRDLAAAPGARAFAVLGDMLELGAFEAEAHRALGAEAAAAGVAVLAAFGPRARATAEAAGAAGLAETFHTEDLDRLVAFVRERLRPTDVLLVKGSRGMKLERLVEALR
ncbi:UDP-N-acetylmuramoylalanyl-D-glutamyl-2,6-diaminopimelate/D-alanyl-D-alanyl ligase [Anaeromyxobacter sp. K]|uniref:UDP-N-acetylmuramoyl-tripeptide--D-alanyl-D- alanine ligase n=1 Tax=Anaeromyxobacter sp. (strain K) TaxID=447217 RepID=UPI00015F8BCB|nr:UDP-N-acetylmuramoyl-tripeptide--D-alanyl-D-alanine ligase [Anaeromyxobacter sp. K]ACG75034.1 UDP-N-acetylmuramoylalanyl-D-glutamyl-2,6-diaminopimelate/D-alanyl-D-alanyl ligase [Anaeromyxobacter sp. K]